MCSKGVEVRHTRSSLSEDSEMELCTLCIEERFCERELRD
jgi:hypothetical protein